MKHLEDKRECPNCGHELHEQPYLMSRKRADWVPLGPLVARAAWALSLAIAVFLAVNA